MVGSIQSKPENEAAARVRKQVEPDAFAWRVVLDVSELPDRTSPDDWPEAMLVTSDELRRIILMAFDDLDETPPA